jgi:ribosomal protein S18 acetylase RimI-like enzyme
VTADSTRIEHLRATHNRAAFQSGVEALDRYLREQAGQDVRKKLAAVFVLIEVGKSDVLGFCTLSSAGINAVSLLEATTRRLGRYPTFPAVLLGRLAVDVRRQGQGFGQHLLYDALRRSLRNSADVAAMALVVDAIHDAARGFYERNDCVRFEDDPQRLYIPMKTIERVVGAQSEH